MEQIMKVETEEIENLTKAHNQIIDNRYIQFCDESGIERFEKVLGATPFADDTLEDRKMRCLIKWNQRLPYNYSALNNRLIGLCGADGYYLDLNFASQKLVVKLALGVRNQFSIVKEMIESIVPCNIVTEVALMYNTHEMLSNRTHEQLATRTHESIRGEVV